MFGKTEDSNVFWNETLLPETANYFQYSLSELQMAERKPTALYFAFLDLTKLYETGNGLVINQ